MATPQKITPFLWFNDNAEQAVAIYTSVFKNSRTLSVLRYTQDTHRPKGSVMTIDFELDGQRFTALNGGPHYTINEAISFVVRCDSQSEIDEYWDKLTADGGTPVQCGWLKDRFGVSWQVVPANIGALLTHPVNGARVTQALLQMIKLDLNVLTAAAEGR